MSTTATSAADHIVVYSLGAHRGTVENRKTRWAVIRDRMLKFQIATTTRAQYEDMTPDQQAKAKARQGYFIGCTFKGGRRLRSHIQRRQFITLDIDEGTPAILKKLRDTNVFGCEHIIHSTRSHNGVNKIKLHVIIPLAEPVDEETWHAMSRIVASWVDPTMMAVDTVSYRYAQIMYLPSTNADVEPVKIHHTGEMLTPEDVFAVFDGDPMNIGALPKSEREDKIRVAEAVAENPLLKRNWVGAWCRTYDIHDVIEMLGPEFYEASDLDSHGVPTRYSYMKGHSSNGAVVYYHDGTATKLHSHHSTDPIDGQANAWDLYEIHKFGHLNDSYDEKKRPTEKKSYKAMVNMIQTDAAFEDVRTEHRAGLYGVDAETLADGFDVVETEEDTEDDGLGTALEAPPAAPSPAGPPLGAPSTRRAPAHPPIPRDAPDGEDWRARLSETKEGIVRKTLFNVIRIIRNAPGTRGRIRYNEFARGVVIAHSVRSKKLGIDTGDNDSLDDRRLAAQHHLTAIQHILSAPFGKDPKDDVRLPGWGLEVPDTTLKAALMEVGRQDRYHPIKTWLDNLPEWDETPRIERLFELTCDTNDDAYHRAVGRLLMTGAVARGLEPGCKYDYLVILEGQQGAGKSRFVRNLAPWPELVGESEGHFDDEQKFVEATIGYMFVELPELSQFRKTEATAIKNMLSKQWSTVRLSYRPDPERYGRSCVMIGTTNEAHYLTDNTGHRRMWPIVVPGKIDLAWLEANHAQLWAEAYATYKEMRRIAPAPADLPFLLEGEAEAISLIIQRSKVVHDIAQDYAAKIEAWLDEPVPAWMTACGVDLNEPVETDDGLAKDETPTLRAVTCAEEIFDRVFKPGSHQTYDTKWTNNIGKAMSLIPGWETHPPGIRCGRYGYRKTYRRMSF